jgi:uncharacterized protein YndB with AHSA1/START domain
MVIHKEETTIRRMPSFVWPYLATAEMLPRWNDRIRRIFPKSTGPFCRNFKFDVTLLLKGTEQEYTGEIVEFVEHRRIVFKMRSKTDPALPVSTEIITLEPVMKGTKIERTTEMYTTEKVVSWWVKLLRRIFGFGRVEAKPQGDQTLNRLAALVEKGN